MNLPFKKHHTILSRVNNEQGIMGLILVIILILGIALGVYLVQTRTNLFPKAFQSLSGPSEPLPLDSDGDGFSDNAEVFMGTNPNKGCPSSALDHAWPVDVNNDKSVDDADMSTVVPYVNGTLAYNRRYDLNQDGKINGTTEPPTGDVAVIQRNMLRTCGGGVTPSASPGILLTSKLLIYKGATPTNIGEENSFEIHVSSPTELVNLVSAQLSFSKDQFEVKSVEINKSVFKHEIEKFFDNNTGQLSIITGVNSSGIKDSLSAPTTKVAEVRFKVKGVGIGKTNFESNSKVIRSSDNANILNHALIPTYTITNVSSTPSPTPGIPVTCKPRPDIIRTSQMTPQGLRVNLSSSTNNTTPTNRIKVVTFHRFENATVQIGNQLYKAPFTYNVPSNENSVSFIVNQVVLNQSTLVELKAGDVCGETSLFFGGGTQAGWPTVIPSPPGVTATTPPSTPCVLTKSEWIITSNPVNSNTTAELRVEASGSCANQQASFVVLEDDGVLGTDPVKQNPQAVTLIPNPAQNNFAAKTFWITEFQEDGVFGSSYPPEFKFYARLVSGGGVQNSIDPQLQVLRQAGQPSPEEGDVNGKGGTNLDDMSWMLSNWGPIDNEFADYNKDKVINNFDIQHLVGVLKQKNILRK